jgi:hypothetical protein
MGRATQDIIAGMSDAELRHLLAIGGTLPPSAKSPRQSDAFRAALLANLSRERLGRPAAAKPAKPAKPRRPR